MHIIGGTFRHITLYCPKGQLTRPTSGRLRESLFNICQGYIQEAVFLDLFAGSGAMGLEALSRGASHSTFVELSKEALKCLQRNIEALHVENQTRVFSGNVFYHVEKFAFQGKQFDIIYADPPYSPYKSTDTRSQTLADQILEKIDSSPILKPGGSFFLEDAKRDENNPHELHSLKLQSAREMGRSTLYHYVKEDV